MYIKNLLIMWVVWIQIWKRKGGFYENEACMEGSRFLTLWINFLEEEGSRQNTGQMLLFVLSVQGTRYRFCFTGNLCFWGWKMLYHGILRISGISWKRYREKCTKVLLNWAKEKGAIYAELNYGSDIKRLRFWKILLWHMVSIRKAEQKIILSQHMIHIPSCMKL